ncbi:MAG TPA: SGNH/GDSL hydrolase family protein [Allosphingosinicella sp.]|jgi:lysophospholipase L1-like esterase|nr:SGNH/GDSL hydrolase family protein [Allosphingosinicella sp.]
MNMNRLFTAFALLIAVACSPGAAQRDPDRGVSVQREVTGAHWVGTWASSQMVPVGRFSQADLTDATLRQVVRISLGGERIRIRLSNRFGARPLRIESVRVARSADPATARIAAGSGHAVTFAGRDSVTLAPGADAVSDPVDLAVPPLSHLAISFYLPQPPSPRTSHPGSRTTTFLVHGNRSASANLPGARTIAHWCQLAGVDVIAGPRAAAIVAFGDSITDGFGIQPNSDQRWPDFLAARLQADPATRHLAMLNQGISGNRVLAEGFGPSALARFERDVLGQPGIKFVILLEGINDLGMLARDGAATPAARRALVTNLIAAYGRMIARARARGIKVIGATILPFGGSEYRPDAATEADRRALNTWIRAPGHFDAVIDFDAVMRDPAVPIRMRRTYDSGDGLHPSAAGYRAMAEAVPLALFR